MTSTSTLSIGDIGSWDAPVGSPAWVKRTHVEALTYLERKENDVKHLERYIDSLQQDNRFQQLADQNGRPFLFWESYCTTQPPYGLGYAPSALAAVIQERKTAQARMAEAAPLQAVGTAGPGRGHHKTGVDNTGLTRGATNADYLAARLKRDAPDVAAEVARGEHASVRAAAKKAGLVKERWSVPADSMATMAMYLRGRLSAEQRAELVRQLGEP